MHESEMSGQFDLGTSKSDQKVIGVIIKICHLETAACIHTKVSISLQSFHQ